MNEKVNKCENKQATSFQTMILDYIPQRFCLIVVFDRRRGCSPFSILASLYTINKEGRSIKFVLCLKIPFYHCFACHQFLLKRCQDVINQLARKLNNTKFNKDTRRMCGIISQITLTKDQITIFCLSEKKEQLKSYYAFYFSQNYS